MFKTDPAFVLADPDFAQFHERNPGIDLRTVNLTDANLFQSIDLDAGDRDEAVQALRAYQRLARLGCNGETAQALKSKGYDSAQGIAAVSEELFLRHAKARSVPLPESELRATHARARVVKARVQHLWTNLHDVRSPHLRTAKFFNAGAEFDALATSIPDYPALFGSIDYCECEHCKSIFGPAAYFTDLMRVVATYITDANPTIPAGFSLAARRPDLFTLELTCDNTNTVVPFLTIANQALASVISTTGLQSDADYAAAIAVSAQNLPMNLPLDKGRESLSMLNASLARLYETLLPPDAQNARQTTSQVAVRNVTDEATSLPKIADVARERCGLSVEQQAIVMTATTSDAVLSQYFDVAALNLPIDLPGTYSAAASTTTVTASSSDFKATLKPGDLVVVAGLLRIVTAVSPDTNDFTVDVSYETGFNDQTAVEIPLNSIVLFDTFSRKTGYTATDLTTMLRLGINAEEAQANIPAFFFVNLGGGGTWADLVSDNTDPNALFQYLTLNSFSNGTASRQPLRQATLDRLNRFARLSRWSNLAFADLDIAIRSSGVADLSNNAVYDTLAAAKHVSTSLRLKIDETCALWSDLNTYGRGAAALPTDLYDRIFNRPVALSGRSPYRPQYASNPLFTDPITDWMILGDDSTSSTTRAWLTASLGLSDDDLTRAAAFAAGGAPRLSLSVPGLSALYRLKTLSAKLRLALSDMIKLMSIAGISSADWTPSDVTTLMTLNSWVKALGLTLDDIYYLVCSSANQGNYKPLVPPTSVLPFLQQLWKAAGEWRVSVAQLENATVDAQQARALFEALVSAGYINDAGAILLTKSQFVAVASAFPITAKDLEALDLIDEAEAQLAYGRMADDGLIDHDGVLQEPVTAGTDLSFTFPPSTESESQIQWIRSVLEEKSVRIGFQLVAPLLPLAVTDFVQGTITLAEATLAFGELQTHGVLDAQGSLAVPFRQTQDLSYLFAGERAKIDLARAVLVQQNDRVNTVTVILFDAMSLQIFGAYGELANLVGTSTAIIETIAPGIATQTGVTELVASLITPIPPGKPIPLPLQSFFDLLGRTGLVAIKMNLQAWDLKMALQYPAIFNFSNLFLLDLAVLRGLSTYKALLREFAITSDALANALAYPDPTFAVLSKLTGWPERQIAVLSSTFWPPDGAGWNTVAGVSRMAAVFSLGKKISLSVNTLLSIGDLASLPVLPVPTLATTTLVPPPEWETYVNIGDLLFNTFVANDPHDGEDDYDDVVETLNENRRDAYTLIALQTIQTRYPQITSVRDLSDYLLLDLETGGCLKTSPIAQAIASVQTYMQSCRLQLQEGVKTIPVPEVWWEWLSVYRVWEANRKIFVYPENYIEPGLQKSATPLFKQFRDSLGETEITAESVDTSYTDFMNAFAEEASIQMVEGVRADVPDPTTGVTSDTLFIVGRSQTEPYEFYTRRLLDAVTWTPWQKVDLKIAASRVVPIYAVGRLFLFWTETEIVEQNNISGSSSNVQQTNAATWRTRTVYAFLRFGGTWSAPQTLAREDVFAFKGYDVTYAPWGIDYTTIDPRESYWKQPNLIQVPASDPTQERLIITFGRAWQENNVVPNIKRPERTPFAPLNDLLNKAYEAAVFGNSVIDAGFVGGVTLMKGFTIDPNLTATMGPVVMQTQQGSGIVLPLYGAATPANGGTELAIYLANNLFVAQAMAGSDILDTPITDINPWYQAGPKSVLFNLATDVAIVRPIQNQTGWMLFNNSDEAFLATAHISGLKKTSDVVDYNPFTIEGPNDIILYSDPYASSSPDLDTVQVQFYRLTTGAINRVQQILWAGGVPAMLDLSVQLDPGPAGLSFTRFYPAGNTPATGACDPSAATPSPPSNVIPPEILCGGQIDFGAHKYPSAYSAYWRELYFQIPFLIANQLNQNQKFDAAKTWYEYVFNPTISPEKDPSEDRFWRYLPFRDQTPPTMLQILSDNEAIRMWNNNPFDPHAVAALRISAYQKSIVMKYIDNLIDWADGLFARDTRESITQATLLYFLAADLLGPRPRNLGACDAQPPLNFNDILDIYGNDPSQIPQFLINLEQMLPAPNPGTVSVDEGSLPFNDINAYFCVPENPEFLAYWDRIEDRLFKIRHCMNIEGVVRSLALFEPPIDPALLAQGGANLVLSALDAGVPHYRFSTLLERARNLTATLIGLGQSLLQALDRRDAEQLAVMQQTQQRQIQKLTTKIRELAVSEAEAMKAAMDTQLQSATYRQTYYNDLIDVGLLPREQLHLDYMTIAALMSAIGGVFHTMSSFAFLVPNAGSPFAMTYGGKQIGSSLTGIGKYFDTISGEFTFGANLASTLAGYDRRAAEWELQSQLAGYEIEQLTSQIAGAVLRVQMAERELEVSTKQTEQADEMLEFLSSKFTNEELFTWMSGQLSGIFFQTYNIAHELALAAQKALQFELDTNETFVSYGYWNSLRKGLTSGEALMLTISQMESAYLRRNTRRLVINKTISLLQVAPLALLNLREKGSCTFELPAYLFDSDFPGQYVRKITSLSVTIPAVTGPYEGINGTLTQTGNFIVLEPDAETELFLLGESGIEPPNTSKLRVNWKANQSIAISTGIEDSGLAVDAEADGRYSPFEGTGAISQWRLELPQATNRVDIGALPDVVIQLSYTALPGGPDMSKRVIQRLEAMGYMDGRLLFLANQYSDGWFAFMNPAPNAADQVMTFRTPGTLFPSALRDVRLVGVGLSLALAPNVYFSGQLSGSLKIPGHPTAIDFSLGEGAVAQTFTIDPADADFTNGTWTMTVPAASIPDGLKANGSSFLDPQKLLNIGLILLIEADVGWTR